MCSKRFNVDHSLTSTEHIVRRTLRRANVTPTAVRARTTRSLVIFSRCLQQPLTDRRSGGTWGVDSVIARGVSHWVAGIELLDLKPAARRLDQRRGEYPGLLALAPDVERRKRKKGRVQRMSGARHTPVEFPRFCLRPSFCVARQTAHPAAVAGATAAATTSRASAANAAVAAGAAVPRFPSIAGVATAAATTGAACALSVTK